MRRSSSPASAATGRSSARLLFANGLSATVLEHDADQVETVRKFGWQVFYGDATRLDLLRTAGAATARVLVLAIDDIAQSVKVAQLVREHFPLLTVVARARNVTHWLDLREQGVTLIERETLDSALMTGRSVLELAGFDPHQARTLAMRFRRHKRRAARGDPAAPRRRRQGSSPPRSRAASSSNSCSRRSATPATRRRSRAGWSGEDDEDAAHRPADSRPRRRAFAAHLSQLQLHLH